MAIKAQALHQWKGRFHLEERPVPQVEPTEVLIKIKACGVGLILSHLKAGFVGGSLPRIMGHEIGGIV